MFHGSKNKFEEFNYNKIGLNGTREGYGFYFTDNKTVADNYANNGYLYTVDLNIKHTLKDDVQELTEADIVNIIKIIDPSGDGFLSNFGDVDFDGYAKILSSASDCLLNGDDNDVDIIGGIIGAGEDIKEVLTALTKVTNKNCIISTETWVDTGADEKIIVMFHNEDIKIKEITEG